MALEAIIREKMVEALKAGQKEEKSVYSGILTALKNKSKDLRSELTPDQETEVIMKLAKQNAESIETCPNDRTEILSQLSIEKSILAQFMPKQMDEVEIEVTIKFVLESLGIQSITPKEKGKVMKELMPLVKGKADGKLVNKIMESFIK